MKDILQIVTSFALGLLAQWLFYKYQKRDAQNEQPKVLISRIIKSDQVMVELRNIGKDSLSEMQIQAEWEEHEETKRQFLQKVFTASQNIQTTDPMTVEILGMKDQYLIPGIPQLTDDGIVRIFVSGIGAHSHRIYRTESEIQVGISQS